MASLWSVQELQWLAHVVTRLWEGCFWICVSLCCPVPAGHSKEELRRVVRRLGTACAVLQLGAAFAACRALRTSKVRQRLVAMDLRYQKDVFCS